MTIRPPRRGFTIIELLVTMVLILLVFEIGYKLLLPSLRIWAINQSQANLEETGVVLLTRMLRDIDRSTAGSLAVSYPAASSTVQPWTQLQAASFATTGTEAAADSYDPTTGQPIWTNFIIYYSPANSHVVYRKIWPVPGLSPNSQTPPELSLTGPSLPFALPYSFPNSKPIALAEPDLIAICNTTNGTEQVIARSVDELKVEALAGQNAQITLEFSGISPLGTAHAQRQQDFAFRM